MALDAGALEDAVRAILAASPANATEAANNWAGAYDDYCSGAMFGASTPTLTGKRAAFASTLAAAFAPVPPPAVPVPGTPAAAFGAAVAAYWTAVPVVGVQSGATNGCPGSASVPAALVALCVAPSTADLFAAGFAAALHAATLTVTATVSPPSGTVLPIT